MLDMLNDTPLSDTNIAFSKRFPFANQLAMPLPERFCFTRSLANERFAFKLEWAASLARFAIPGCKGHGCETDMRLVHEMCLKWSFKAHWAYDEYYRTEPGHRDVLIGTWDVHSYEAFSHDIEDMRGLCDDAFDAILYGESVVMLGEGVAGEALDAIVDISELLLDIDDLLKDEVRCVNEVCEDMLRDYDLLKDDEDEYGWDGGDEYEW